jgi:RNA polymerase sigma factor (sigma-70 family)
MSSGQMGGVLDYLRQVTTPAEAMGQTDKALVARFVEQREEAAFASLVQRHGPMVLGVCQRVLRDAHEAEDAFQATFLVLSRRAASLRKQESVGSWLYGVAYRTALKSRVGVTRRRARERQAAAMTQREPEATAWQELRPVLDTELSHLPEKYRAPLVLCYLEGKTNAEAARLLGWTKGTVSGRLARARDLLRGRLVRRGLTLAPALLAAPLFEGTASAALPASLAVSTVKAAVAGAAPAVAAGLVSSHAVALAEGVSHAMFLAKLKAVVITLAAIAVLGTGGGLVTYHTLADETGTGGPDKAGPSGRQAGKARTDQEALQGTWVGVSVRKNGEAPGQGKLNVNSIRFRFAGDKVTLSYEGKRTGGATYRLDPNAKPKEIHFLDDQDFNKDPQVGIYELEGNTLTLCVRNADQGPPTEFAAEKGSGSQMLMVLRRQTPRAAGGADGAATLKEENEKLRQELERARRELTLLKDRRAAESARAAEEDARQEVNKVKEAAARVRSANNLKQLALAMHNYLDVNKTFPPPAIYSEDGKALLSWRVALLPYVEESQLYKQFKLDQPWDSQHNKRLLARMPKLFAPVAGKAIEGHTYYQVFTGKGTVFPGPKGIGIADITDGTSKTVMIVEAGATVPWTKPADLPYKAGRPLPKLGGLFHGGFNMALCDGSVRFVGPNFNQDVMRALITRNDNQPVGPADLDKK